MKALASALLLALAANAAQADDPFEGGKYMWECQDTVERGASRLIGTWTVQRDKIINPGVVTWNFGPPIQITDAKVQRTLNQWAQWNELTQPDAFARGTIFLTLKSEKRLPRYMILSFGGILLDGDFVTQMTAYNSNWGQASVNLGKLMRWAGDKDQLPVSIFSTAKDSVLGPWLGSGTVPMANYHQLERDFAQQQVRLKAKAANYLNECQKVEYPETADIDIVI